MRLVFETCGLIDRTQGSQEEELRGVGAMVSSVLHYTSQSLRCQWDAEVERGGGGVSAEPSQGVGITQGHFHPHFPGIQKSWGVRAPCTSSDPPSLSHLCLSLVSVFLLLLSLSLSYTLRLSPACLSPLTFSPPPFLSPRSVCSLFHRPLLPAAFRLPAAVPPSLSLPDSVSTPSPPTTPLSMFPGS